MGKTAEKKGWKMRRKKSSTRPHDFNLVTVNWTRGRHLHIRAESTSCQTWKLATCSSLTVESLFKVTRPHQHQAPVKSGNQTHHLTNCPSKVPTCVWEQNCFVFAVPLLFFSFSNRESGGTPLRIAVECCAAPF